MNTRVEPGALNGAVMADDAEGGDDFTSLRVGSAMSQSDIDKLMARGGNAIAAGNIVGQRTGWDGLTPVEEARAEQERIDAEYREIRQEQEENEARYQEVMREFDRQEEEIHKKIKAMEDETFHLHGKAVFMDELGRPRYEDGTILQGADRQAALDAKAAGQKIDDYNALKAQQDAAADVERKKQEVQARYAQNTQAANAALANGDPAAARTATDANKALLSQAQQQQAIDDQHHNEIMGKSDAGTKLAAASTDASADDFDSTDDMRSPNPSGTQTSRASFASQLSPSSNLSSKGSFTLASAATAPATADNTVLGAAGPQKNTAAPAAPAAV